MNNTCVRCGAMLVLETCWQCGGAGGFHDCGEDTCCCLYPDEDLNDRCEECHGEGVYVYCPDSHKEE